MSLRVTRKDKTFSRYLFPHYGGRTIATTDQTATAGRIYVAQFVTEKPALIDQIIFTIGTTAAGNVTGGVYRAVAVDTPDSGAVVVQSASTAVGSSGTAQGLTLSQTLLAPGTYYMALEFSNGTCQFKRNASTPQGTGFAAYFDQSYGALPSTVPTTTAENAIPAMRLRVVQS